MQELSLNILDIAENSVKAGATLISVEVCYCPVVDKLTVTITDDGCGMDAETVRRVCDPFYTTRTTRKVGMGLSLMKMEAQMSGGDLSIESTVGEGTTVTSWFDPGNIDMPPLGDLTSSITTLIQGSPDIDFVFTHRTPAGEYTLDTGEIRQIMGDISLSEPEIIAWLTDYLHENESNIEGKR